MRFIPRSVRTRRPASFIWTYRRPHAERPSVQDAARRPEQNREGCQWHMIHKRLPLRHMRTQAAHLSGAGCEMLPATLPGSVQCSARSPERPTPSRVPPQRVPPIAPGSDTRDPLRPRCKGPWVIPLAMNGRTERGRRRMSPPVPPSAVERDTSVEPALEASRPVHGACFAGPTVRQTPFRRIPGSRDVSTWGRMDAIDSRCQQWMVEVDVDSGRWAQMNAGTAHLAIHENALLA